MSYWQEYETDKKAEQRGKWFDFKGGLQLRIARADADSNLKFAKRLQELQADPIYQDEGKAAEGMIELYASLVTDAKGLVKRDGTKLDFSAIAIKDLFIQLPEIFKIVRIHANDFNNFKLHQAADDLKKS